MSKRMRMALIVCLLVIVTAGAWNAVRWFRHAPARQRWHQGIALVERDPEAAERAWLEATRLSPNFTPPYRLLAQFYVASEQWAKAEPALRRLLTLTPREPHLACQLAEAQFHLRHDDGALQNARRELERNKNCGRAHLILGRWMIRHQDERGAVEHLSAAMRSLPDDPDVAIYLAQAYIENMSLPEGQRVLTELMRKQPDNAHVQYMLGFCYARNIAEPNHTRKAENALNEALRLNPNHSGAHFELGRLFFLSGRSHKAVSHLQTSARLNPDYPPTFYNLAQAYRRLGQTDQAREAQKRFAELNRLEVERSTRARRAATNGKGSELRVQGSDKEPYPSSLISHPLSESGLFTDVAAQAGIRFAHSNGATGQKYFIETTGSGCAFFDYDNDGWLDVLLLNGKRLGGRKQKAEGRRQFSSLILYHNNRNGTFTDVTRGFHLMGMNYAQGVAVGDYDNDGFDDLYITAYGSNFLFRNEGGNGKFSDVTKTAGVANTEQGPRWSLSSTFFDYDNDGNLDLFVCHYVKWTPQTDTPCSDSRGNRSYCHPQVYDGDTMTLYRNNGNGTFTDVTKPAGIAKLIGRGMGVVSLDYNKDGREDLYVSNDLMPNFLLRNNGNGTFTDVAFEAGVAFSDSGQPLSGMGVGVGDYDNNGFDDLFVTNFAKQGNSLYRNEGNGFFRNETFPSRVGNISLPFLGFGCEFFDYDLDGDKDLVVANGHVMDNVAMTERGMTHAQRKSLYRNNGDGTFSDVTQSLGDLAAPRVSRGLAVGDFDNDGDLDILVNNQNAAAQLLRNNSPLPPRGRGGGGEGNHWIAFKTIGVKTNRSGRHAKITMRVGKQKQFSEVRSGSSYCSHSDDRVFFGLGQANVVDEVQVRWLSGGAETFRNLAADRVYVLTEGKGYK